MLYFSKNKTYLYLLLLLIHLMYACGSPQKENVFDFSEVGFKEYFGDFQEIPIDSVTRYLGLIDFPAFGNSRFYYAYNLDGSSNYTSMNKLSLHYENARELYFLNDLKDSISQVFVEMKVEEPRSFNLHNPELEKTITLTNKSFFRAKFDFVSDTISYLTEVLEQPTSIDKTNPLFQKVITQHNQSKSKNSLKLLKKEKGFVLKNQLADYRMNKLNLKYLDTLNYQLLADTIYTKNLLGNIFNQQEYKILNEKNQIWKTTGYQSLTTNTFNNYGNIVQSIRALDRQEDQYASTKFIDWTTTHRYNSFGLLISSLNYKEINKDGKPILVSQVDFSYTFYFSKEGFLKVELFQSIDKSARKLYTTTVFNEFGNWVKVEKADGAVFRKIIYQ